MVGDGLIHKISRTKNSIKQLLIPGMWFENMGITYLGPVDGHNIRQMTHLIREARKIDHAVLIHVVTKKGKGYAPAEQNPPGSTGWSPSTWRRESPLSGEEVSRLHGCVFHEDLSAGKGESEAGGRDGGHARRHRA